MNKFWLIIVLIYLSTIRCYGYDITTSLPMKNQTSFVNLTPQGGIRFVALVQGVNFGVNNIHTSMFVHLKKDNEPEIVIPGIKQSDDVWKFDDIISVNDNKLPDSLSYYTEYIINRGGDVDRYYDNNEGLLYKLKINPVISINVEALNYENGNNTHVAYCRFDTDLPIMDAKIRFFEQAWQSGSALVFSKQPFLKEEKTLECHAIIGNDSHVYNKIESI